MTSLVQKVKLIVAMCADRRLTDADFRVAAAEIFAFFNTTTGQCNPSGQKIAKASACCRDTVIEANKKLARLGYMEIEQSTGGRNKRNAYRFNWAKGERETVDGSDSIETETVGTSGKKLSEPAAETVDGSDTHITQEGTQEGNTGSIGARKRATSKRTRISPDAVIDDYHLAYAAELGIQEEEARRQFLIFKDHHLGNGNLMADWQAAWRTWCRKHLEFAARRGSPARPQHKTSTLMDAARERIQQEIEREREELFKL